jgi:UDP-N-acetyl-D-mannosaminuronic acid dehydrogenase
MGAIDGPSLKEGLKFYRRKLRIPVQVVSPIEVAEMAKVAENAYRYVQIAFAEEMRMVCETFGLDFEDVRKACNSKWNIEILEARDGIGGHCLPKEIKYFISLSKHNTFSRAAVATDAAYRGYLKKRRKHL